MKKLVLMIAVFSLSACGGGGADSSAGGDSSNLFTRSNSGVVCHDAHSDVELTQFDMKACSWLCKSYQGRAADLISIKFYKERNWQPEDISYANSAQLCD